MKILVVDDEFVSRKKLQKILGDIGDCRAVGSASAAMSVFEEAMRANTPFDLITLDIGMPVMDGTQLLEKIRKIEDTRAIPKERRVKILMVSGISDKETVLACIQNECDDFIVKPFNKEIVLNKLSKVLSPSSEPKTGTGDKDRKG